MKDLTEVIKQLKIDEGFRKYPYLCSAGKKTIGYGWNLDDVGITREMAEKVLVSQVEEAHVNCQREFSLFWHKLNDTRKDVLINMCFNIGINRLKGFKKMISALENDDYHRASTEMIDSKWYRQVGPRAERLVGRMYNGE